MASVKGCLAKLKRAGHDVSLFSEQIQNADSVELARDLLLADVGGLRREHVALSTKRTEILSAIAERHPELQEAVAEHVEVENQAQRDMREVQRAARQVPSARKGQVEKGLAARNVAGLPKKQSVESLEAAASPKQPKKSEKGKSTAAVATAAKEVQRILSAMRRVEKKTPTEDLAPSTLLKRMSAADKAELRKQFPEAKSALEAIKLFQKTAKRQVNEPKKVDDVADTVDESLVEGADKADPQTVRVEMHQTTQSGKIDGIEKIAKFIASLLPGSRWAVEKTPGEGDTFVVEHDEANLLEVGTEAPAQQVMQAVADASLHGRTTTPTVTDPKSKKKQRNLAYVDARHEEHGKFPLNSIDIAKLGALVDTGTPDANMNSAEKSLKQFYAGVSFLMERGFIIPLDVDYLINTSGLKISDVSIMKGAEPVSRRTISSNPVLQNIYKSLPPVMRAAIRRLKIVKRLVNEKGEEVAARAQHGDSVFINRQAFINHATWLGENVTMEESMEARVAHEASHLMDNRSGYMFSDPNPFDAKANKGRTLNVWYGTKEHAEFSNLAERPFRWKGKKYRSVEHAYQTNKSGIFDKQVYKDYKKARPGRKIVGKRPVDTKNSFKLMNELVYESFQQNPRAAAALMKTNGAQFTHQQDKGVWKNQFPKALHAARDKLLSEVTPLKNNIKKTYKTAQTVYEMAPEGSPIKNWLSLVFDSRYYGEASKKRQYRELVAQLGALYHINPTLLENEFPAGYDFAREFHEHATQTELHALDSRAAERGRRSDGKGRQSKRDQAKQNAKRLARAITKQDTKEYEAYREQLEEDFGNKDPRLKEIDSKENPVFDSVLEAERELHPEIADGAHMFKETEQTAQLRGKSNKPPSPEVVRFPLNNTAELNQRRIDDAKAEVKSLEAQLESGRAVEKKEKRPVAKKRLQHQNKVLYAKLAEAKRKLDEANKKAGQTINASHAEAKAVFDALNHVTNIGNIPRTFPNVMGNLFKALGIKTKVIIVDQKGAETLMNEPGMPAEWKKNLKQVLKDKPRGRLLLSTAEAANERFAVVYIDSSKKLPKQQEAFMHELGHIVQLDKLDQAPAEVKEELVKAYHESGSQEIFEEWFANQLLHWANTSSVPKTILGRFFKELVQALKKVYNKFRGNTNLTYTQFMDSLLEVQRQRGVIEKNASGKHRRDLVEALSTIPESPFLPQQSESYYDFHPSEWNMGVKNKAKKVIQHSKETGRTLHEATFQTSDAYLRSHGLDWLADQFHHRPDVRGSRVSTTIEQETRIAYGGFEPSIQKVIDAMNLEGRWLWKRPDTKDPEYQQAVKQLILEQDSDNPIVVAARQHFKEVADWLEQGGVKINRRENYFPIMFDKTGWAASPERVIEIAMSKLGMKREEAEKLYYDVSKNPEVFGFDQDGSYDPNTAATFSHTRSRRFGRKEHEAFMEFINSDIASVVKNYTHQAVKHVVTIERFNPKRISLPGQGIDPLYDLKNKLRKMYQENEISQAVYDKIREKIIPAYFGQLGANMPPALRTLSTGAIVFQNWRLLGFSQLASLPDFAGVVGRSGTLRGHWKQLRSAIRELRSEDARMMYRTLGIIRDDLTEAVMNDPVNTQYYSPKLRSLNEAFFRLNGLHALTNLSRIYSFSVGKQFIRDAVARGDTQKLTELGLTAEDVKAWERDGMPLHPRNEQHKNILAALHQFVDESILRPSAPMRPVIFSDQRFAVFGHLKSFIFTYHETILRRIWSQLKEAKDIKDPAKLIPVVSYFATAITLAMVGYELRQMAKSIGDDEEPYTKEGFEYFFELVQRAGMLGTMQFMVDAYEAEGRGNLALLSLMGPTVSNLEMMFSKDYSYTISRTLPPFTYNTAMRSWLQDML